LHIKKGAREVERETSLVQPMHMEQDNVKTDHKEAGCDGVAWIYMAKNRDQQPVLVNMVINT
jgi:hypothetical protein